MLHELKISKYLYPPLPTCALISGYQGSTEKLKEALLCFNLWNPECPAYDFYEKAKIF